MIGVCIVSVYNAEEPIVFQNLGIARVKVKEIKEKEKEKEKEMAKNKKAVQKVVP